MNYSPCTVKVHCMQIRNIASKRLSSFSVTVLQAGLTVMSAACECARRDPWESDRFNGHRVTDLPLLQWPRCP